VVLLQDDQLDESYKAFDTLVGKTRSARFHRAYYNLGVIESQRGNPKKAIAFFRESILLNQNHVPSYLNMAKAHMDLGQYQEARGILEKAARLAPDDYKVSWNLGLSVLKLEGSEASTPYFENTLRLKPDYAPAHYNLGLAKLKSDQFEEAIAAFDKATRLDPQYFAAWKNLGICYSRLKQVDKARSAMARAVDVDASDAPAVIYLSRYLKVLKRSEEIPALFRRAADAGAKDTSVFRALASEAFEKKRYADAIQWNEKALALDPSPKTYYNLALAHRRLDHFAEAAKAYRRAIELDPQYAKAWLNLGYALLYQSQFDESEKAIRQALRIQPDYANALDGLKDLESRRNTASQ